MPHTQPYCISFGSIESVGSLIGTHTQLSRLLNWLAPKAKILAYQTGWHRTTFKRFGN